jgi:8-oxo-dGTP pyrophosphatase MutT (NUDIX family)
VQSRDGLVLLADRRGDADPLPALPGGKPEAGESFEECAVRELAEETGLAVNRSTVHVFGCTFLAGIPAGWVVVGVAGEIDSPAREITPREREPDKVGGFTWIDPRRPPGRLYPASRALLELYEEGASG